MAVLENRAVQALRRPANWIQLLKFGVVGTVGYAINLGVYVLILGIGAHEASFVAFVVAATSNYWWNRHWTFVDTKGHFGQQGAKFFAVSFADRLRRINQLWLLDPPRLALGLGKLVEPRRSRSCWCCRSTSSGTSSGRFGAGAEAALAPAFVAVLLAPAAEPRSRRRSPPSHPPPAARRPLSSRGSSRLPTRT